MKNIVTKLLMNRNVYWLLAFCLGIVLPQLAPFFKKYLVFVLTLMMTISLAAFSFKEMGRWKEIMKYSLRSLLLGYLLYGGLLYGLAYLFVEDEVVRQGFLFVAITPPGVVIVPMAILTKANVKIASIGVMAGYVVMLLLLPLTVFLLYGGNEGFDWNPVWNMLLMLFVVPLILSESLKYFKLIDGLNKVRGRLIDAAFVLIIYTIIGLNKALFVSHIEVLLVPVLIFAFVYFVAGELFLRTMRQRTLPPNSKSYQLLFLVKNSGFAAVVALSVGGEKAAIPSAALSLVLLLYLMYFAYKAK